MYEEPVLKMFDGSIRGRLKSATKFAATDTKTTRGASFIPRASETGLDPVALRLRSMPSAPQRGFEVLIANDEDLFGNRGGNMGDPALTEEIKAFGRELGLDLVGICHVDSLPDLERLDHKQNIEAILPQAKSIIVGGIRMVDSAIEASARNVRIAQYSTMCLYQELNHVAYGLLRFLDDRSHRAAPVPSYLPVDMFKNYGLIADVSLRHAAVEAGLGTLGTNQLLITDSFGPRVRLMAILTEASLVPDTPLEAEYCDDCGICIEQCPAGAISEEGVDVRRCTAKILKFGLPGLARFARRLVGADEEKLHEAIKSPEFAEFWQDLSTGIFYYCFECLNACPIGQ